MRRELTKSARRGERGERLHPDLTFVLVPEHLFWKKTRGTFFAFFLSPLIFLSMQPLFICVIVAMCFSLHPHTACPSELSADTPRSTDNWECLGFPVIRCTGG